MDAVVFRVTRHPARRRNASRATSAKEGNTKMKTGFAPTIGTTNINRTGLALRSLRAIGLSAALGAATAAMASTGVTYQHYRFKVNAVYGPNAEKLEISHLGFFCEGKELSYTYSSVSRGPATSAYGSTTPDDPSRVLSRGDTSNLYADWNGARGNGKSGVTDADRNNCYIDVSFAAPVRIDSYAFKTGTCGYHFDGCRAPKDFQLFGSNDGENWTLLDTKTGFQQPDGDRKWCSPIQLGGANQGNYTTDAKWFRLSFRSRNSASEWCIGLGEFALYNIAGSMISLTNVVAASSLDLAPGEAIVLMRNMANCYEGYKRSTDSRTVFTIPCMFDQKIGGAIYNDSTLATDKSSYAASIWVSGARALSEFRNVCVLLRLPADAPAVAAYNLSSANGTTGTIPRGWILEASYDGVTWFLLDERTDEYMTTANNWFNARPYRFNRAVPSASGATLTVGSFDRSGSAAAPASSIVKVGEGDWIQAGASPASVDVRGGSIELFPKFDAYRFRVDRVKEWANQMRLSEVALYDGETRLTAASVCNAHPDSGDPASRLVNNLTSDNYVDEYGATSDEAAAKEALREQCWLRMDYASPVRVTSWAFWRGDYSSGSPKDVRLQGSRDGGTTWIDIDVRTNSAPASNFGKAEFVRPEYAGGTASDIAVSLSNGGELKLNEATRRVSSLTLDCATDGGSLDVFAPAPNGTLRLTGVTGSVDDLVIPLTVDSFSGMENFRSWTLFVNGVKASRRIMAADDHLVLAQDATVILFH